MKLATWQNILWRLIKKIFTAYRHFGHILEQKSLLIPTAGLSVTYPPSLKLRDSRAPYLNSLTKYGQDSSTIEAEFESYAFVKPVSKDGNFSQQLTDFGRKKRSNRSSNRVDEENPSAPDK